MSDLGVLDDEVRVLVEDGKNRTDFSGKCSVVRSSCRPCFSGKTRLDTRDVIIEYNPEFESGVGERKIPKRVKRVVGDILCHEFDHHGFKEFGEYGVDVFRGCPRSLEGASVFIEEISKVLGGGYSVDDVVYVANSLEDLILHSDLSVKKSLDGMALFYENVGESVPDKKFTSFYEAFVRLNVLAWGNKAQKGLLRKFCKFEDNTNNAVQDFLRESGISGLKQDYSGKKVKDRGAIRDFLNDEGNWPVIARTYAEAMKGLMTPGFALPIFNHDGEGTKGKRDKDVEGVPKGFRPKQGNFFDKQYFDPKNIKKRVEDAHSKGEVLPPCINSFDALDLLYESFAQRMQIKVQSFTSQDSFPVVFYGRRDFDPDRDDEKRVDFGFDERGKVCLKKPKHQECIPIEYKVDPKSFPKAKFGFLDASGSMTGAVDGVGVGNTSVIPWGDNSKYHYALVAWYSFLEYLKQNYLLNQQDVSLALFSVNTYVSKGLQESKESALSPVFGIDTKIDCEKAKDFFADRNSLVFTISDGEVSNWSEIKDEFIKGARNNFYFHLQIGGASNAMCKSLKRAGLPVVPVESAKDLAGIVIDLTDKVYRTQNSEVKNE